MKSFSLLYAPAARQDMTQIFQSVLEASASVKVATSFTSRIEEKCRRICDAPLGGKSRSDLLEGLRTVPFERSALVAYTIDADTVEVLRIFYHGQDYETLLRDPSP